MTNVDTYFEPTTDTFPWLESFGVYFISFLKKSYSMVLL